MRWFKHLSSASDDPFLVNLEARFGLEGYARWWKLLEAVASQVNPKEGRWTVSYPWAKWQQILQGKRKKLEPLLCYMVECGRVSIGETQKKPGRNPEETRNIPGFFSLCSGNILEIGICNLQKYIDEYSRKSGHTPDKLRTKDTDTEAETEKDKGTPHTPPHHATPETEPHPSPVGSGECVDPEPPPGPAPEKPRRTKKAAKAAPEYTASFLAFWEAYPRKVGKAAAFEAWQAVGARMKAEGQDARGILAAIKAQVAAGHLGADIQHVPHPATWLNNARWEDEIATPGALPAVPGARGQPQPRTFHQRKQAENEQKANLVLLTMGIENGQNGTPESASPASGHALPVGQVGT